jgi:phosphoglucomutase
MTIEQKVNFWLESKAVDEQTKAQIIDLQNNNKEELEESFYKDLEFGTGGLRGIMGVGSNRMNKYTIGMATQGLANYLKKCFTNEEISVAIAHDSRNNSDVFSKTTADVFTANGIKVYFFEGLRPTPELSFAIRELGCKSGVVLTASHNPKEYNGYKAYWTDGAQMVDPHDKNVISEVQSISSLDDVNFDGNEGLIEYIGNEIDEKYLQKIKELSLFKDAREDDKAIKIVYSSIHGTGITLVPKVLELFGFNNVHVVEEQSKPDGNFPTVVYPNPEEAEAMSLALKQAESIDADVVMATDPDSDRVGIAVKNPEGNFELLNGNQTGSLLIYYLLSQWKKNGQLNGKQYIVKTIVTTELIKTIADGYQVDSYDTLTGFKFIASLIKSLEGKAEFIGGGEESYGYLISDFVRDKDAIASCAMIAEMTAYAKSLGKSVYEYMLDMYAEYGLYREKLISITKKGKSGSEEIKAMMAGFRDNTPTSIAGKKVVKFRDYQFGKETDMDTKESIKIDFPSSNVLQFFLEDGTKISARPSGTEPKIKFYFSVNTELHDKANYKQQIAQLDEQIAAIVKDLEL